MSPPAAALVRRAQALADDVLFPAALETDAADTVPAVLLDAIADGGFYGLPGPVEAGGLGADHPTTCAVIETLASGCLPTTFLWSQHLGAVRLAAASESPSVRGLLEPLCRGALRAGVVLAGARPGPSSLRARRTPGGWQLDGSAPWVSGWGRVDLFRTAARDEDERIVWLLVDADRPRLAARTDLVTLQATATVELAFDGVFVPDDRLAAVEVLRDPDPAEPAKLRVHAALALGVAARCCALLGASPLDAELAACRAALDDAGPADIAAARAGASDLVLRAAAAQLAASGSRGLLRTSHAQRLAREALFAAVYAGRPAVKAALLDRLGAVARPSPDEGAGPG